MGCKYPENSRSYKACALCSDKNICEDLIDVNNITTLLSAKEARYKTKENLKTCSIKELVEISEKILEAIADGKFSISGNGDLQIETKQRLEELGYEVKTGSQYNELLWKISWN